MYYRTILSSKCSCFRFPVIPARDERVFFFSSSVKGKEESLIITQTEFLRPIIKRNKILMKQNKIIAVLSTHLPRLNVFT